MNEDVDSRWHVYSTLSADKRAVLWECVNRRICTPHDDIPQINYTIHSFFWPFCHVCSLIIFTFSLQLADKTKNHETILGTEVHAESIGYWIWRGSDQQNHKRTSVRFCYWRCYTNSREKRFHTKDFHQNDTSLQKIAREISRITWQPLGEAVNYYI